MAHVDGTIAGLTTAVRAVEEEFQSASTEAEKERKLTKLRLHASNALLLHRALPWIEDAVHPPLELGALYFIDEVGEALLDERADIVPTRSGEYSTEQQPFTNVKVELKDGERRTVILNFPALEDHSFPLLPLFGHELGHTTVTKYRLLEEAVRRTKQDAEYEAKVRSAAQRLQANRGISEVKARFIIDERLYYWVTELLCDQLAIQYLGPSYLLAFATYVSALTWDTVGPRHPPATHRVGQLLRWVERTGWAPILRDRMPQSQEWLEAVASMPPRVVADSPLPHLVEALDFAHPHIAGTIADHLGTKVFGPELYVRQAGELDTQLAAEVLPVQSSEGVAFERRAIVTSGWFSIYRDAVRSAGQGEGPAALVEALRNSRSHQFFTKALEVSRVVDLWAAVE